MLSQVHSFPDEGKEIYVITRSERQNAGKINFYSGDLKHLIQELKTKEGKNIFCDGGAEIVNELLKHRLFDELVISIVPVLVGNGIKLFQDGRPEQDLELLSSKLFDTGLVQVHYKMNGI